MTTHLPVVFSCLRKMRRSPHLSLESVSKSFYIVELKLINLVILLQMITYLLKVKVKNKMHLYNISVGLTVKCNINL